MIQELDYNDAFELEIQEYLTLKSKASRHVYSSAFKHFLDFYRNKYGKDNNNGKSWEIHFLCLRLDALNQETMLQKRISTIHM